MACVVQFTNGTYRKGRGEWHPTIASYRTPDIKKARVYRIPAHAHSSMRGCTEEYKIILLDVVYPS